MKKLKISIKNSCFAVSSKRLFFMLIYMEQLSCSTFAPMNRHYPEHALRLLILNQLKYSIHTFLRQCGTILFHNGELGIGEIGNFRSVITDNFELFRYGKPHFTGYGQTAQSAYVICHASVGVPDDIPILKNDIFIIGITHGIPFHIYGYDLTAVFT